MYLAEPHKKCRRAAVRLPLV